MSDAAKKTVHLALPAGFSDWETGHAAAHLRSGAAHRIPGGYPVRTASRDGGPVTSMGGLHILADCAVADLDPADSALLILPGGTAWDDDPERTGAFAAAAREFTEAGVPVAAICGATAGLARAGLLDGRAHTGPAAEYLAATGYAGGALFRDADAVTDRGVATAGPTAPVAFAREVFALLDVFEPEVLDAWYRLFAHRDASAYPVLAEASA
ncbi:DJ-1/PfpI family protein [Nocardiopsis coralliicola]